MSQGAQPGMKGGPLFVRGHKVWGQGGGGPAGTQAWGLHSAATGTMCCREGRWSRVTIACMQGQMCGADGNRGQVTVLIESGFFLFRIGSGKAVSNVIVESQNSDNEEDEQFMVEAAPQLSEMSELDVVSHPAGCFCDCTSTPALTFGWTFSSNTPLVFHPL